MKNDSWFVVTVFTHLFFFAIDNDDDETGSLHVAESRLKL